MTKTAKPIEKTVRKPRVTKTIRASSKRTVGQIIASLAAGFLPCASFEIAHYEMHDNPYLAILVVAALVFSAPTLVEWAKKWCVSIYKAVGFSVLLESVMIFSNSHVLSYTSLAILCAINMHFAYHAAAKKEVKEVPNDSDD